MVAGQLGRVDAGPVSAGSPRAGGHGSGSAGMTHVVVGQGRRRHVRTVGVGGGHPTVTMDIVVVGARVAVAMHCAGVGTVGRDVPGQRGPVYSYFKPQVLCGVVHVATTEEPYAFEVERHINLVAGVGVPSIDP